MIECDVVVLAGGKGKRLYPLTMDLPKPMVRIGDMPVLEHLVKLFEYYGLSSIKILVGYKGDIIKKYFHGRYTNLDIQCIDTGSDADTAERLWQVRNKVSDTFFLSYSDVLADIDLQRMYEFHEKAGKKGTMATYPLTTSYGIVHFDGDNIAYEYREKPMFENYHINAGFFVFNSSIFDTWEWGSRDFSKGMIVKLARERQLACYRHDGFWSGMDTVRENEILNEMWNSGDARWAVWRRKRYSSQGRQGL